MPFEPSDNNTKDHLITGVVIGIVSNNEDPEKLGRVKVIIPRITGDDESNWARVCSFMTGNNRGAFFLPEVDDEVLVAFEHGDINTPYVIGSLWNGQDALPEENSDGLDDIRLIKSRSGHLVVLDDTDGSEKIEIKDGSGETLIAMDTNEKTITIESGQDINISAANGKVTIEARELELTSTANAKIDAGGDLELSGTGTTSVKGSQVNLN